MKVTTQNPMTVRRSLCYTGCALKPTHICATGPLALSSRFITSIASASHAYTYRTHICIRTNRRNRMNPQKRASRHVAHLVWCIIIVRSYNPINILIWTDWEGATDHVRRGRTNWCFYVVGERSSYGLMFRRRVFYNHNITDIWENTVTCTI